MLLVLLKLLGTAHSAAVLHLHHQLYWLPAAAVRQQQAAAADAQRKGSCLEHSYKRAIQSTADTSATIRSSHTNWAVFCYNRRSHQAAFYSQVQTQQQYSSSCKC
jgi:invasion protein IalB